MRCNNLLFKWQFEFWTLCLFKQQLNTIFCSIEGNYLQRFYRVEQQSTWRFSNSTSFVLHKCVFATKYVFDQNALRHGEKRWNRVLQKVNHNDATPPVQEKSVIHKRSTENKCVTADKLGKMITQLYFNKVLLPLLLLRCHIYRLISFSFRWKSQESFSSKQSRWIATVWVTKHYNSRYRCAATDRHDWSFSHRPAPPLEDAEDYVTHKSERTPGSVTRVSVVTVRLARRRFPAAVRGAAASRQTGKTEHHHRHLH